MDKLSALMQAANAGDANAYRTLLTQLAVLLRSSVANGLRRANRGSEDIEDIVQETLLAIHLKRKTWDPCLPLEPWVRAIAHYKLVDCLRRRGFRDHLDIDDYADSLAETSSLDSGQRRDWSGLLASLPAKQQHIVRRMSVEGHTAREVGKSLDMSESAVRTALHRALRRLASLQMRETK